MHALNGLGFVVDPSDARVGITACIGTPGCASARADTTSAAARLASSRRSGTTPTSDPVTSAPPSQLPGHQFRRLIPNVHLSACEKRCGAPAGAIVFVADEHGHFTDASEGAA